MRGHGAERRVAHAGEKVIVGHVAGADQLDPRLVEAALDEFLHEHGALAGRHKDEHRVRRVVLDALQERGEIRILQRHANLLLDRSAALLEGLREPFLGVDAGAVIGDKGDDLLDPVLQRPLRHRHGGLRKGERGADDIGRFLGDHRGRGGGDDLGNLRLRRDLGRGQCERRQPEAHQDLGMVVADKLFGEALGHVRRAGVVLDLEHDLLAGDRVAVLMHVKLGGGAFLPAGRGERPGHRQNHADDDGVLVRPRRARRGKRGAERGGEHPVSRHEPFSSRPAVFHRVPTLSLSRAQAKDRPWAYGRSAFAGRAVELGQDTVGERAIIVRLRWRCAQAEFADRLLPAD